MFFFFFFFFFKSTKGANGNNAINKASIQLGDEMGFEASANKIKHFGQEL